MVAQQGSIEAVVDRGVSFLKQCQLPHGEFPTYIARNRDMSGAIFDSAPFVTTLVIHSLSHFDREDVKDLIEPALDFLGSEVEFGGVWRYYSSRQFKRCRVPPDLDDTACAIYELKRAGRRVKNVDWIFRYCQDEKNRYVTWMIRNPNRRVSLRFWFTRMIGDIQAEISRRRAPPQPDYITAPRFKTSRYDPVEWDDVDPVVNANVILLLGDRPETEHARAFVIEQVMQSAGKGFSNYYHDVLILYYMAARAYRKSSPSLAVISQSVTDDICARQSEDGSFGSHLMTALAIYSLQTFAPENPALKRALSNLINEQQDDGSWNRSIFYAGPGEFWGSEALTTAICIEVIARSAE